MANGSHQRSLLVQPYDDFGIWCRKWQLNEYRLKIVASQNNQKENKENLNQRKKSAKSSSCSYSGRTHMF